MLSMYSIGLEDPYENLAYNPRWEFPRDRLTLGEFKGSFVDVVDRCIELVLKTHMKTLPTILGGSSPEIGSH